MLLSAGPLASRRRMPVTGLTMSDLSRAVTMS